MSRLARISTLAFLLALPAFCPAAHAEEAVRPDDTISFDLSAEDWVTTKTAHVTLAIEASVNSANAGSTREEMSDAVNDVAKADWRLTAFTRTQDQTGMERWSVAYEARLPENHLNGLAAAAKKNSKAGLQISVADVDFSPTLDEMETAKAALRARLVKEANEQLSALNGAETGRTYRLAQLAFEPASEPVITAKMARRPMMMAMASVQNGGEGDAAQERAKKLMLTAHATYATPPTVPTHEISH